MRFGILFGVFSYGAFGTVNQEIDREAGRYRVTLVGEGTGLRSRVESAGLIREGRFLPVSIRSAHTVRGRENTLAVDFDHERHRVEYHGVAHTFFLGRRRQVDDVLRLPQDRRVDDLLSATLNFAEDRLERSPDGTYGTWVVRRTRPENEGPDDVSPSGYRAELVPVRFKPTVDPGTGLLTALLDVSGFSSWARPGQPARVVFGPHRFLQLIDCPLILGSTLNIRLTERAAGAMSP
jgi:hypothetical protein